MHIARPGPDECADYYRTYIDLVPDGDLLVFMDDQKIRFEAVVGGIPADRQDYAYAPGKWTTRQVVGHVLDTEWIFTYRALRVARGDETPLAGMDQDEFMKGANFSDVSMDDLAAQFVHLRSAALILFSGFDERVLERRGTASGYPFTVRALLFVIAGHLEHHLNVISQRYR